MDTVVSGLGVTSSTRLTEFLGSTIVDLYPLA